MKAGVLLVLLCAALFTIVSLGTVVQEKQREIDYYRLSLSEIGNDMAINYQLHKNAVHALKSCR